MLRIRNMQSGQVLDLGSSYTIELVDQQDRLAMVWLPGPDGKSVRVCSPDDDAHVLQNYARTNHLETSRISRPPSTLTTQG